MPLEPRRSWLLLHFLMVLARGLVSLAAKMLHASGPKLLGVISATKYFSKRKVPKGLPHVDVIEKVSPTVVRVLGLNPGPHTLQGTNTYLVGTGSSRILVDTGEVETAAEYLEQLFDIVFPATGAEELSAVILTHGHADHQGGVRALREQCQRRGLKEPAVHKHCPPGDKFPLSDGTCLDMADGQIFSTEGATLRVLLTPGHCSDHASLILQEDNAVLSGDCVLGCGTTVFENLSQYMDSLRHLQEVMERGVLVGGGDPGSGMVCPLTSIYPGHGPVIRDRGIDKVKEYILHREAREKQVLAALSEFQDRGRWMSSWEIMRHVYRATLKDMSFVIKGSAQGSTLHNLEKLEREGVVEYRWPDLWRLRES